MASIRQAKWWHWRIGCWGKRNGMRGRKRSWGPCRGWRWGYVGRSGRGIRECRKGQERGRGYGDWPCEAEVDGESAKVVVWWWMMNMAWQGMTLLIPTFVISAPASIHNGQARPLYSTLHMYQPSGSCMYHNFELNEDSFIHRMHQFCISCICYLYKVAYYYCVLRTPSLSLPLLPLYSFIRSIAAWYFRPKFKTRAAARPMLTTNGPVMLSKSLPLLSWISFVLQIYIAHPQTSAKTAKAV